MKKKLFRMISFILATLMIMTSIPSEAVLAAENAVETMQSESQDYEEEMISAEETNSEDELNSEEVLSTEEMSEEILTENSTETDELDSVTDADEVEFVPNDDILELNIPTVDWSDTASVASAMPYYLNEEVLGALASDATYDSRDDGNITSVKNQKDLGTCWAFATIGALEASILKNYRDVSASSLDLSEYQLAYFKYKYGNNYVADPLGLIDGDYIESTEPYDSLGDFLYQGFDPSMTALNLMSWKGVINETDAPYPYSASNPYAAKDYVYPLSNDLAYSKDAYRAKEFYMANMTDRTSVKQLILDCGAVTSSYCSESSNGKYTYYGTGSYFLSSTKYSTNHAILIVGWDDDYSKDNFSGIGGEKPEGNGAWIVKNSWGTNASFMKQGYFYLSYYEGSINRTTSYALGYKPEKADRYDNNYQYDGNNLVAHMTVGSYNHLSTVYTAASDKTEYLEAVSFGVDSSNVQYTVNVYTDLPENFSNPTEGEVAYTSSGSKLYSGYYTIEIPKEERIELDKGEKFAVEVIFSKSTDQILVTYSYSGDDFPYVCVNETAPKTNFVGTDDDYWLDMENTKSAGMDLRIKAYTVEEDPVGSFTLGMTSTQASSFNSPTSNVLSWAAVTDAVKYEIYASASEQSGFATIGTTTSALTYTDTLAIGSAAKYYYVKAINSAGEVISVSDTKVSKTGKLSIPNITATLATDGSIQVSVPQMAGATGYVMERKTDAGSFSQIKSGNATELTYVNSKGSGTGNVQSGYYYTYRIQLSNAASESEYSNEVTVFSTVPKIDSVKVTGSNSVTVTWAADGRSTLNVYQVDSNGGYINAGTASTSATNRVFNNLTKGTEYRFALCATKIVSGITPAVSYSDPVAITILSAPGDATGDTTLGYSRLSWIAVSGAVSYAIYRRNDEDGEYQLIGSTEKETYTDVTSGIVGKDYYYKIQAIGTNASMSYLGDSAAVQCVRLPNAYDLNNVEVKRTEVEITATSAYVSYAIRLKDATTALTWKNKPKDSQKVIFSDLESSTEYTIYVKVIHAEDSTAVSKDITTKSFAVALQTAPTVTGIEYGQTLEDATLSGAVFTDAEDSSLVLDGTLQWVDKTQVLTIGKQKAEYKFVPTNTDYPEFTGEEEVTVTQATPSVQVDKKFITDSDGTPYVEFTVAVSNSHNAKVYPKNMKVSFAISFDGKTSTYNTTDSENGACSYRIKLEDLSKNSDSDIVITVSDEDGNFKDATSTAKVNLSFVGVAINKDEMNLVRGESNTFSLTTTPIGAKVDWTATEATNPLNEFSVEFSADKSILTVWDCADINSRKAILKYNLGSKQVTAIGDSDSKDVRLSATLLGRTDSVVIHIYVPVESLTITYDNGIAAEGGITLRNSQEVELDTAVVPENANEKEVTFSSSNSGVAVVENNKLIAVGFGTATITASTKNGLSVVIPVTVTKPNCTGVEAYGKTTGLGNTIALDLQNNRTEELSVKATLDDNGQISYVTDVDSFEFTSSDSNIAKVSESGEITAVGAGTTAIYAYYAANRDYYDVVNVEVTGTEEPDPGTTIPSNVKLTAVNSKIYLDCGDSKEKGTVTVMAGDTAVEAKDLKFSSANSDIVMVSEEGIVRMNPSYTPTGSDVIVVVTAALRGDAANRKVTVKVTVSGKPLIKAMDLQLKDTAETIAGISRKFSKGEVIHLQAVPLNAGNMDITDLNKLKWSVSDSSVAAVKVTGNATADITMKKAGSCAITVTSPDAGKYARTWNAYFVDTNAIMDTKSLTVNKLMSTNASQEFNVLTNYGMQVVGDENNSGITVNSVKKGKTAVDATKFTVVKTATGYALSVEEETLNGLANGTYDVSLTINTNGVTCDETTGKITVNGDDLESTSTIKLSVVAKVPTVKLSTVKMNRFYKSELTKSAGITSTNGAIESISIQEPGGAFDKYFSYEKDANGLWTIHLDLKQQSTEAYAAKSMKGTIVITVAGYKPITKSVTIQTPVTKPTLKMASTPSMQLGEGDTGKVYVQVVNKAMPQESLKYTIENATNMDRLTIVPEGNGKLSVSSNEGITYKNNATEKSTVTLASSAWNDVATLQVAVKTYTTTVPKMVMKKNSISLSKQNAGEIVALPIAADRANVALNDSSNWSLQVPVGKNYSDTTTDPCNFTYQDSVIDGITDGKVILGYQNGMLLVQLCEDVPVGTYKYRISNMVKNYATVSQDITIKVTDAVVSASASASGSMNLLDRTVPMQGKVTVKNSMAAISDIEITNSNYEIIEQSGNVFWFVAKKDAALSIGIQTVAVVVTLEGNKKLNASMRFTTKQTYPAFKTPAIKTLRKALVNGMISYNLSEAFAGGSKVSAIEVVSAPKGVSCEVFNNSIVMRISDGSINPGTYRCTVNMYFEGAETNAAYPKGKPLTKVISVKVIE